MITNHKPKQPEIPSEEEKKQEILNLIAKENLSVLSLAYYYAKGYDLGGDDVTKAWDNTIRQTDALNRAYQQGFMEGIKWQREKQEKKGDQE